MSILVLGINHKTATVELRGKVAFSDELQGVALQQIYQQGLAKSAVILSTCNRTEVYLHAPDIKPLNDNEQQWVTQVKQWFCDFHQLTLTQLNDHLYYAVNVKAVQHLMRVSAGLDSLIIGEPQILGQVKQAFQFAQQCYQQQAITLTSEFSRLFQSVFFSAKRIRRETDIGGSAVSVAYAATALAKQIFEHLSDLTVLLVGAGETIELVSRYLVQHGVTKLTVVNRTLSKAQAMSERVAPMQVCGLERLEHVLINADVVITSTASPHALIDYPMMQRVQKQRRNKPMLMIDIAVPADIDVQVAEIDSIYHYSVDDLQHIIEQNLAQRQKAAQQAEAIVQQESQRFFQWMKRHQSSLLIKRYRHETQLLSEQLLIQASQALAQGQDPQAVLNKFEYQLRHRLLHIPTKVIQHMVETGNSAGLQQISRALQHSRQQKQLAQVADDSEHLLDLQEN